MPSFERQGLAGASKVNVQREAWPMEREEEVVVVAQLYETREEVVAEEVVVPARLR